MLRLSSSPLEGVTVLRVEGRLDSLTSEKLQAELPALAAGPRLVLDLTALEYISSAGLHVLEQAARERGGLAVFGLSELCRQVFEVAGFLEVVTVSDTREAAIEQP